jgi:hypothetical protein
MQDWIERIDKLDISVFESIYSQTTNEDKWSLLAVQRATAGKYKEYVYLEIGSHLGGSIQPHLVDDRCKRIYSIDPRPSSQPDERSPGYVAHYENNSTQRMLQLLGTIGHGDLGKIECFDLDASEVDPKSIRFKPRIVLIDGQHTNAAVLSDYRFCSSVVDRGATILFHDFGIVALGILEICKGLERRGVSYVACNLEGAVFGIFLDPDLAKSDPDLLSTFNKNVSQWRRFRLKERLKRVLPGPVVSAVKRWKQRSR